MIMYFTVQDLRLLKIYSEENAKNLCRFSFKGDWADADKVACFRQGVNEEIGVIIENDQCEIPKEINIYSPFHFKVMGIDQQQNNLTVNSLYIINKKGV